MAPLLKSPLPPGHQQRLSPLPLPLRLPLRVVLFFISKVGSVFVSAIGFCGGFCGFCGGFCGFCGVMSAEIRFCGQLLARQLSKKKKDRDKVLDPLVRLKFIIRTPYLQACDLLCVCTNKYKENSHSHSHSHYSHSYSSGHGCGGGYGCG